jgi:hypothetical protein
MPCSGAMTCRTHVTWVAHVAERNNDIWSVAVQIFVTPHVHQAYGIISRKVCSPDARSGNSPHTVTYAGGCRCCAALILSAEYTMCRTSLSRTGGWCCGARRSGGGPATERSCPASAAAAWTMLGWDQTCPAVPGWTLMAAALARAGDTSGWPGLASARRAAAARRRGPAMRSDQRPSNR